MSENAFSIVCYAFQYVAGTFVKIKKRFVNGLFTVVGCWLRVGHTQPE